MFSAAFIPTLTRSLGMGLGLLGLLPGTSPDDGDKPEE